jgi:hypothetical protein
VSDSRPFKYCGETTQAKRQAASRVGSTKRTWMPWILCWVNVGVSEFGMSWSPPRFIQVSACSQRRSGRQCRQVEQAVSRYPVSFLGCSQGAQDECCKECDIPACQSIYSVGNNAASAADLLGGACLGFSCDAAPRSLTKRADSGLKSGVDRPGPLTERLEGKDQRGG